MRGVGFLRSALADGARQGGWGSRVLFVRGFGAAGGRRDDCLRDVERGGVGGAGLFLQCQIFCVFLHCLASTATVWAFVLMG